MTLALAQAFCHGYSAAKGWTIPPDGTTSDDGAQDDAQDAQESPTWKNTLHAKRRAAFRTLWRGA
jgi:hypothetical protein